MKQITIALLGSATLLMLPASVHGQEASQMTAALDCGEDGDPASDPVGEPTASTVASAGGTTTDSGSAPASAAPSGADQTSTESPSPSATVPATGSTATPATTQKTIGYVTNGNVANMIKTSSSTTGADYYRTRSINPEYKQNLSAVKSYPTPSGAGVLRTIGGQKILVKDSGVALSGLSQRIVNIIDEINLSAAALGLPDPIITAGFDKDGHSPNSDHYTGNAIDLRCNAVSTTMCKKWVIALANATGPGYDVIFEDYGNGNSHVHIGWTL